MRWKPDYSLLRKWRHIEEDIARAGHGVGRAFFLRHLSSCLAEQVLTALVPDCPSKGICVGEQPWNTETASPLELTDKSNCFLS